LPKRKTQLNERMLRPAPFGEGEIPQRRGRNRVFQWAFPEPVPAPEPPPKRTLRDRLRRK
jgi:hypothetical protein